jgi:DNA polymerase/3'-5' exonuclease PolX
MSENLRIAARLRETANRLGRQHGRDAFRAEAFRRAAESVEKSPRPLRDIFERHGPGALQELPGIGPRIAGAVIEMLLSSSRYPRSPHDKRRRESL